MLVYELPQVRFLVAHEDVFCRDVANHARNARVGWGGHHVSAQHIDELIFGVGLPRTVLVAIDKLGACYKCARVQLDFVGAVGLIGHERAIVALVAFGRCGEQVQHDVSVRLESEETCKLESTADGFGLLAASVGLQDVRVNGLDAHLDFRAAERTQLC